MNIRNTLYLIARILGDINAVKRGDRSKDRSEGGWEGSRQTFQVV